MQKVKRLKFLHFGDLHLDMPFTSLGTEDSIASERRAELLECFDNIISLAKAENVNVILVSGDLFEHSYVKKSTINHINQSFKKLNEIKVFITPGNHDPLIQGSYYRSFEWSENVHILEGTENGIYLSDYGAFIYGKAFKSFYEKKSLVQDIKVLDKSCINILLIHGTVDMGIGQKDYNPMTSAELESLGMDYIALGHFHNRVEIKGRTGVAYNPGSPEPLGFDEPGRHGVYIGTITKNDGENHPSFDIHFAETSKRFYRAMDINVSGLTSNDEILDKIILLINREEIGKGLYDIILKGCTDRLFKPDAKLLQKQLNERVYFARIKDETTAGFDIESISNEPGLKGLYVKKLLELINSEQDQEKIALYRLALNYGLQAMENGEVEID